MNSASWLGIAGCQQRAGTLEVCCGVDAERHGIDDRDVDAHVRFERAQLLEPLLPLERRGRQLDEAFDRRDRLCLVAGLVMGIGLFQLGLLCQGRAGGTAAKRGSLATRTSSARSALLSVGAGANMLSFGRFQNADGFASALA